MTVFMVLNMVTLEENAWVAAMASAISFTMSTLGVST